MNNREEKIKKLIEAASSSRDNAYAPYSQFFVGASIMMKDGTIFGGCNIENASYGLSNCAERTALFKATSEGYLKEDIEMMCVIGNTLNAISPCGACRQVMNELLNKDTPIILANLEGKIKETNIKELLPYSFDEVEHV